MDSKQISSRQVGRRMFTEEKIFTKNGFFNPRNDVTCPYLSVKKGRLNGDAYCEFLLPLYKKKQKVIPWLDTATGASSRMGLVLILTGELKSGAEITSAYLFRKKDGLRLSRSSIRLITRCGQRSTAICCTKISKPLKICGERSRRQWRMSTWNICGTRLMFSHEECVPWKTGTAN